MSPVHNFVVHAALKLPFLLSFSAHFIFSNTVHQFHCHLPLVICKCCLYLEANTNIHNAIEIQTRTNEINRLDLNQLGHGTIKLAVI